MGAKSWFALKSLVINYLFWLRQEAQEVTLFVRLSVCVSVCDICEFYPLSKREILRLVTLLVRKRAKKQKRITYRGRNDFLLSEDLST